MNEGEPARYEAYSEAHGVRVRIDADLCVGFAECVVEAPQAFALNVEDRAVILDLDAVDMEALKAAAASCPVSAILVFGRDGTLLAPTVSNA